MRNMQKARDHMKRFIAAAISLMLAGPAAAAVIYNGPWTSGTGNYQLTVTDAGTTFNWSLTVSPWNAEALGLFVDFGNVEIPNTFNTAGISGISTSPNSGTVVLFAQDTASTDCGNGCNINGSPVEPLAVPDGQWELVFRLADNGFDGIQTFNFTTPDFGLTEAAFGLVAIRSQQLCPAGSTLSANSAAGCGGSEKVLDNDPNGTSNPPGQVPEPGTLALMGLAFFALVGLRRKRAA